MKERNRRKRCKAVIGCAICMAAAILLSACVQITNAALPSGIEPPASGLVSQGPSPSAISIPPSPSAVRTAAATRTPAAAQAVCIKETSVYTQPNTKAAAAGRLSKGDKVDILSAQDGWMLVSAPRLMGYAKRESLITQSAPTVPVPEDGWAMTLVNQTHLLPAEFTVALADFDGGQVDARILEICGNMFADAKKDGAALKLVDAYRSRGLQSELYERKVQSYIVKGYSRGDAEREAATITARPDTSEHQTGLALDIVSPAYTSRDRGFEGTRAFAWLNINAANYGFTLRYGQDKEQFTGVIYEPWHWRFAGAQAAAEMKETGQSLEEYLGQLN